MLKDQMEGLVKPIDRWLESLDVVKVRELATEKSGHEQADSKSKVEP